MSPMINFDMFEIKLSETYGIQFVLYFPAIWKVRGRSGCYQETLNNSLEMYSVFISLSVTPREFCFTLSSYFRCFCSIYISSYQSTDSKASTRTVANYGPYLDLHFNSACLAALVVPSKGTYSPQYLIVGLLWLSNL